MQLNDASQRLKGLSVSYVQDEDRLLLEVLMEGSSRPLWITRRAALRLIDIFNQQLAGGIKEKKSAPERDGSKSAENKPVVEDQKKSVQVIDQTPVEKKVPADLKAPVAFERDIAATKNPPKPGVMKLNLEEVRRGEARVGVLKTMQFAQLDGQPVLYRINFVDTHNQSIGLKMTRELLLNLETLIIQQIERAQW